MNFEQFLVRKYARDVSIPPVASTAGFKAEKQELYCYIHKDTLRTQQTLCNKLKLPSDAPAIWQAKILFEHYFIAVFLSAKIPDKVYFYGLTDVFEVMFYAFVNTEELVLAEPELLENADFGVYDIAPERYYRISYAFLIKMSVNVMHQIYDTMEQFSMAYLKKQTQLIIYTARKYDESLFVLFEAYPNAHLMLTKYVVSLGSHFSSNQENYQLLIMYFLQLDSERQAFFIYHMLSLVLRAYCPGLLNDNSKFAVYKKLVLQRFSTVDDKESLFFDGLSNAVEAVLLYEDNLQVVSEYYETAIKRFDDWNVGKAALIGIGVGAMVLGITGLVVGGVIGAVQQQKKRGGRK